MGPRRSSTSWRPWSGAAGQRVLGDVARQLTAGIGALRQGNLERSRRDPPGGQRLRLGAGRPPAGSGERRPISADACIGPGQRRLGAGVGVDDAAWPARPGRPTPCRVRSRATLARRALAPPAISPRPAASSETVEPALAAMRISLSGGHDRHRQRAFGPGRGRPRERCRAAAEEAWGRLPPTCAVVDASSPPVTCGAGLAFPVAEAGFGGGSSSRRPRRLRCPWFSVVWPPRRSSGSPGWPPPETAGRRLPGSSAPLRRSGPRPARSVGPSINRGYDADVRTRAGPSSATAPQRPGLGAGPGAVARRRRRPTPPGPGGNANARRAGGRR